MNNAIRHRCREARAASPEHQVKKIRAVKKTGGSYLFMNNAIRHRCREARAASPEHQVKKIRAVKKTGKKKTGRKK